jgi:hypothetical protein
MSECDKWDMERGDTEPVTAFVFMLYWASCGRAKCVLLSRTAKQNKHHESSPWTARGLSLCLTGRGVNVASTGKEQAPLSARLRHRPVPL